MSGQGVKYLKKVRMICIALCFLAITAAVFIAGIHIGAHYSDKDQLKNMAISLVESFGWELSDADQISEVVEQKLVFDQTYKNWTVSEDPDMSSGNIEGITPLFLRNDDIASNDKNVYCYTIPVEYDMPQDVQLQAIVAFYNGKICMSAIYADASRSINKIEAMEKDGSLKAADEDIMPLTWPLNVETDVLEEWKGKFLKFMDK